MDQKRKLKNCLKNIVLGALFLVHMLSQDFQEKQLYLILKYVNLLFFLKKRTRKKTFQKKKNNPPI